MSRGILFLTFLLAVTLAWAQDGDVQTTRQVVVVVQPDGSVFVIGDDEDDVPDIILRDYSDYLREGESFLIEWGPSVRSGIRVGDDDGLFSSLLPRRDDERNAARASGQLDGTLSAKPWKFLLGAHFIWAEGYYYDSYYGYSYYTDGYGGGGYLGILHSVGSWMSLGVAGHGGGLSDSPYFTAGPELAIMLNPPGSGLAFVLGGGPLFTGEYSSGSIRLGVILGRFVLYGSYLFVPGVQVGFGYVF